MSEGRSVPRAIATGSKRNVAGRSTPLGGLTRIQGLRTKRVVGTVNQPPSPTRASLDIPAHPSNYRRMSLTSIRDEIEKLGPAERAALIDVLWDSLDENRIKEIEAKWAAESEDRIDAFERGDLPAVDGPSAIEELRSSLTK